MAKDIERYLMTQVDADLSEVERAALGGVAALLGHAGSQDVIEAMLDQGGLRRTLGGLCDRSLLTAAEGAAGREYSLHAIMRAFYYDLLGERGRRALHRRAADHYAGAEPDPLRAALHALRAGEPARAATAAVGHVRAAINAGQASALAHLLAQIPAERLDPPLRAAAQTAEAELLALLGEYAPARARLEQAIEAGDTLGDPPAAQARRLRLLAMVLQRTSQYAEAAATCRAGLARLAAQPLPSLDVAQLYVQLAEVLMKHAQLAPAEAACAAGLAALPPAPAAPVERISLLQRQAMIAGERGQNAAAAAGLEQALALARQAGDQWLIAAILHNLGACAYDMGQVPRSEAYFHESLALKEQLGDLMGRVASMNHLGAIQMARGEYVTALEMFEACLQIGERVQASYIQSVSLRNIGAIQIRQGYLGEANSVLGRARALSQSADDRIGEVDALCRLGEAALAASDSAGAHAYGLAARQLAREADLSADEGWAMRVIGEALTAQGQLVAAEAELAAAWLLQADAGDTYEQAQILAAQSRLAHAAGDGQRARRLAQVGLDLALEDQEPYLVAMLERVVGDVADSQ
jgi:Tfp pilus assembly protein PilF